MSFTFITYATENSLHVLYLKPGAPRGNQVQPSSKSEVISFKAVNNFWPERTCTQPWQLEAR